MWFQVVQQVITHLRGRSSGWRRSGGYHRGVQRVDLDPPYRNEDLPDAGPALELDAGEEALLVTPLRRFVGVDVDVRFER